MDIIKNYQGKSNIIRTTTCREYVTQTLLAQPIQDGMTYDFTNIRILPFTKTRRASKSWLAYMGGIIPTYCNMFGLLFDKKNPTQFISRRVYTYPFNCNGLHFTIDNYGVDVNFQDNTLTGVPAEWVHSPAIMSLLLYLFRMVYNSCSTVRVSANTTIGLRSRTFGLPALFNSLLSYLYWPISNSFYGDPGVFYVTLTILAALEYNKQDELIELLEVNSVDGMNSWVYAYHELIMRQGLFNTVITGVLTHIKEGNTANLVQSFKPLY